MMAQHEEILTKVDEPMLTNPSELLDKHNYLLHTDFHQLTEGNAGDLLNWIAAMESALTAAEYVRDGKEYTGDPGTFDFNPDLALAYTNDTELTLINEESFSWQVSQDLNLPFKSWLHAMHEELHF